MSDMSYTVTNINGRLIVKIINKNIIQFSFHVTTM